MPLFSIIVPIYNTEKYLKRCIKSILKQPFKDFELILIDDGSTDDSYLICQNYAKDDSRIKAVHKENGGVSSARNKGLEYAKGTYLWFVDSDDYIKPNALMDLSLKVLNEKSDLLIFNTTIEENHKINNFDTFFELYYFKYILGFEPWNKLYLREIIEQNNLKFDEQETIGEDLLFNAGYYKCLKYKYITFVSKEYYVYDNRVGSAMNSKFSTRHIQQMRLYNKVLEILKDEISEKNKGILFLMHLISGINQSRISGTSKKQYADFLEEIFEKYHFEKSIWRRSIREFLANEKASLLGQIRIEIFAWLINRQSYLLAAYLL